MKPWTTFSCHFEAKLEGTKRWIKHSTSGPDRDEIEADAKAMLKSKGYRRVKFFSIRHIPTPIDLNTERKAVA